MSSNSVANLYFKMIWQKKSTLLLLIFVSLSMGLLTSVGYQNFLYLQAQNISGLSVFNELIVPLAGWNLFLLMMVNVITLLPLLPGLRMNNQHNLLVQSALTPFERFWSIYKPVFLLSLWSIVNLLLITIILSIYSNIDWQRLVLVISGLVIINWLTGMLALLACLQCHKLITAILASLAVIFALFGLDSYIYTSTSYDWWRGVFLPFYTLREGQLFYADMVAYFGWIMLFTTIVLHSFAKNLSVNRFRYITLIVTGLMVVIVAPSFNGKVDITSSKRNSYSQQLVDLLNQQNEPLIVSAVIDEGRSREEVIRGYKLLKYYKPNSSIRFVSRQAGDQSIQQVGEYIRFQMGHMEQLIAYPFDGEVNLVFQQAIEQMLARKKQWVTFIEGHGEASPFGQQPSDLTQLKKIMEGLGWPIAVQNLYKISKITDNTVLMVIAGGSKTWLPQEISVVEKYVESGGNLLIMVDPDSKVPQQIMDLVGINQTPGTLIDWNGYQSGTPHPAVVIVNQLGDHQITRSLKSLVAFPWATGLETVSSENSTSGLKSLFEYEAVLKTHPAVWTEFDVAAETLSYNEDEGETRGAFSLAISAKNKVSNQRLLVVGDTNFASDTAINNYDNKQLILNMISWLTQIENQNLQADHQDSFIQVSVVAHWLLSWGISLILPLLVLVIWLTTRNNKSKQ